MLNWVIIYAFEFLSQFCIGGFDDQENVWSNSHGGFIWHWLFAPFRSLLLKLELGFQVLVFRIMLFGRKMEAWKKKTFCNQASGLVECTALVSVLIYILSFDCLWAAFVLTCVGVAVYMQLWGKTSLNAWYFEHGWVLHTTYWTFWNNLLVIYRFHLGMIYLCALVMVYSTLLLKYPKNQVQRWRLLLMSQTLQ